MIWIIVFLFILCDAWVNWYRIDHGNKINHNLNGVYRTAFYILMILVYGLGPPQAIMFLLGSFFASWLLFNFLLNFLRRKPWDYLGQDSTLDRLEANAPLFVIWCKLVCALSFIYAYYHTDLL